MILVIDNYDSFVYNLTRYLQRLGQTTLVVRNDVVTPQQVKHLSPSAIVFSPGPGTPEQAGRCLDIVRQFASQRPMLGVCLGHQILAAAFGGQIVRAREPVHGRSSAIHHCGSSVFRGLPNPMQVGRYHSLIVDAATLPDCLRPLSHTTDGTLMAFQHQKWPIVGLQFHPESVLTEHGYELLAAFLTLAGLPRPRQLPAGEMETPLASASAERWPTHPPITF